MRVSFAGLGLSGGQRPLIGWGGVAGAASPLSLVRGRARIFKGRLWPPSFSSRPCGRVAAPVAINGLLACHCSFFLKDEARLVFYLRCRALKAAGSA